MKTIPGVAVAVLLALVQASCVSQSVGPGGVHQQAGPFEQSSGPDGTYQGAGPYGPSQSTGLGRQPSDVDNVIDPDRDAVHRAEVSAIGEGDTFFIRIEYNNWCHWPEDFILEDFVIALNGYDRGRIKGARAIWNLSTSHN